MKQENYELRKAKNIFFFFSPNLYHLRLYGA